ADFGEAGTGPEAHTPAALQPLLGDLRRARHVQYGIGVREQLLGLPGARAQPCLVTIAAAICPTVADAEAVGNPREVRDRIVGVVDHAVAHGVVRPRGRGLEVVRVVTQPSEAERDLHVHPRHARVRGNYGRAEDDDYSGPGHRAITSA